MADLTVIMPSYNKGKYIADALDSVFSQKTSYSYVIIIADDCSTDGTLDIVASYERLHPGVITVLRSAQNQKLFKNIRRAYGMLKSPYFCVLDPDDFWVDQLKIQKALDYLEAHKDYTIYATNTWVMRQDGTRSLFLCREQVVDSTFDDYLHGCEVVGCTLGSIFRNVVFAKGLPAKLTGELPPELEGPYRGDSFRAAIHLKEGKAHYVPYCDAVYRVTDEGIWQGMSQLQMSVSKILFHLAMDEYFEFKYDEIFTRAVAAFRDVRLNLLDLLSCEEDCRPVLRSVQELKEIERRIHDLIARGRSFQMGVSWRYRMYFRLYSFLRRKMVKHGLA